MTLKIRDWNIKYSTSVNCRLISPFHEGFHFWEASNLRSFAKNENLAKFLSVQYLKDSLPRYVDTNQPNPYAVFRSLTGNVGVFKSRARE